MGAPSRVAIRRIFTLGYRCNADHLLKHLGLRRFSSPFSYILINAVTAESFIRDGFEGFTSDIHHAPWPHNYRWAGRPWRHHLFFHRRHPESIETRDLDRLDEMCIWNHHDLINKEVQAAFRRRESRLLDALDRSPDTCLLLYIAKPRLLADDESNHVDLAALRRLTEDYRCHALALMPYPNFGRLPYYHRSSERFHLISYQSSWSNDLKERAIRWDLIERIIRGAFEIVPV